MDDVDVTRVKVLPGGRLDRKNAAAFVGRKPQTLAAWASEGVGPPHRVVRGRAYYDLSDLQAFVRGDAQGAA